MNKYNFCHLHRHCEASIQDGAGKIEDGVIYAKEMGHPAVAITDHGSLISYVRFYNEAKVSGIKHIFGLEAYLCDDMTMKDKEHREYNHCTILVKNKIGYQNILKLNNYSQANGFYYRPRLDWDTLLKHKEGLIILSGCVIGRTCQYILDDKYEEAEAWTRMMKKEMGDDYYMETMVSDFKEQAKCNRFILELSRKYNIPGVVTGDAHYTKKEDYIAQKVMMLINAKATMKELEEQNRRKALAQETGDSQEEKDKIWIFDSDQYWMKNEEEMMESWQKWHSEYYPLNEFEQHLNESGKIADKVELVDLDTSFKMPKADLPAGTDHNQYFQEALSKAMTEKGLEGEPDYWDRLKVETGIIEQKGLVDYFLVTADVIGWAKRNDVFVGPGRGSAGGSLVCYLLEITDIDPIKHGLLFERFLDLGRVEMPDIDTDFEIEKRESVKQYIMERYGSEHVASISALGTFRARNIIRDVARVYDKPIEEINELTKLIPDDSVFVEGQLIVGGDEFHERTVDRFFQDNPQIKDIAGRLFGQIRHVSKHAAGIIITDRPLDECVATINVGGEIMTAWSEGIYRKELTQLNVLKLDILGLKTLSIIKKACKLIGEDYKNLMNLNITDHQVYDNIADNGLIKGIFQFDSNTGSWLYNFMKPRNFNDIVALSALDRPGPLDSHMAFEYIDRMHGIIPAENFSHYATTEVLKETYGVFVFQEQLMTLAKKLSNFTPLEASALRKNLVKISFSNQARKKAEEQRVIIRKQFIDRAVANGASEAEVEKLWEGMAKFARYGFNKSHSVGYSYITFWTMWLKTYYPVEFYTALLTYSDEEEIPPILNEMHRMGIELDHPDINKSDLDFTPDPEGLRILYGIGKVKFVGNKAQEEIILKKPYTSYEDFCQKTAKVKVNKKVKEALIRSGAFDSLREERAWLLNLIAKEGLRKKDPIPEVVPYTNFHKLEDEKKYLGALLSEDAKPGFRGVNVERQYKKYLGARLKESRPDLIDIFEKNKGEKLDPVSGITYERFSGFISRVEKTTSKSGNDMLILKMDVYDDKSIKFFVMKWHKLFEMISNLQPNEPVIIAIEKRTNKADFGNITHIKKL